MLLLMIVSNSMTDVHAATHAQSELSSCELCATYGDPSDSIPAGGILLPPIVKYLVAPDFCESAETASAVFSVHQRGPPAIV
jgi:hypothetical protein